MRALLTLWLVEAVAFVITVAVVPGIDIDWTPGVYLWTALIFGLVNAILGPIARLLSLPLMLVTLGLFSLVVNGVLFLVVDWIVDALDIDGLVPAIVGALVMTVTTAIVGWILSRTPMGRRVAQ